MWPCLYEQYSLPLGRALNIQTEFIRFCAVSWIQCSRSIWSLGQLLSGPLTWQLVNISKTCLPILLLFSKFIWMFKIRPKCQCIVDYMMVRFDLYWCRRYESDHISINHTTKWVTPIFLRHIRAFDLSVEQHPDNMYRYIPCITLT